jgi:tetratricopeptide (TPR) repeat protein
MSGWIGWLVLLAILGLVIFVLRGIVQFASWLVEEFILEPRSARRRKAPWRPPEAKDTHARAAHADAALSRSAGASPKSKAKPAHAHADKPILHLPVKPAGPVHPPSRFGRWVKRLHLALSKKGFDHWVAAALSEDDPQMKLDYLSKALRLNPAYLPAWGMKGATLLAMGRFDEAIQCFDKSLELHPSALIWHKKGDCCYRLGKREEALDCFNKALQTCPEQDHELRDDIARMRKLVEGESRGARAS